MATPVYEAGKNYGCTWTPSGASSVSLNVTEHSWMEQVDKIDVTNTGSGGLQALLAGILRGTGTVKAFFDSANPQYTSGTGLIRAGNKGRLTHTVASGKSYGIPALITQVTTTVPVAGGVTFEFQIELDVSSDTVGYVYT